MFKKGTGKIISNISEKNKKEFNDMFNKLILKYGEDKIKNMSPFQIVSLIWNDNKGE